MRTWFWTSLDLNRVVSKLRGRGHRELNEFTNAEITSNIHYVTQFIRGLLEANAISYLSSGRLSPQSPLPHRNRGQLCSRCRPAYEPSCAGVQSVCHSLSECGRLPHYSNTFKKPPVKQSIGDHNSAMVDGRSQNSTLSQTKWKRIIQSFSKLNWKYPPRTVLYQVFTTF